VAKEIITFVQGLPHTPGWIALSQSDRDWLQEHTSNAVDNFRQSGLKALQSCAEMAMIEEFLKDKPLKMTNWIDTCFQSSSRTAWRWLANYKEMRGSASDQAILYLAKEGIAGMQSAHAGEIATAIKQLPAPKSTGARELEAWKEKLAEKLKENRSQRSKGKRRKLDPDEAAKSAVVTLRRLMRESRLDSTKEQKGWLARTIGYLMDIRAIPGSLTADRTPPPDGWMPQVGRPRKRGRKIVVLAALVGGSGFGFWWYFIHETALIFAGAN
jgi:hypothetical protein